MARTWKNRPNWKGPPWVLLMTLSAKEMNAMIKAAVKVDYLFIISTLMYRKYEENANDKNKNVEF